MTNPKFSAHDHSHCIKGSMDAAKSYCAENSLKFTPVRQRVFEILIQEHKAMGAYDILAILAAEGLGSQPPVVYRALDFLVKHKFVHRIERLNAYIACGEPGSGHAPAFMICRSCTTVAEMDAKKVSGLSEVAGEMGFAIEAMNVEAEGLCPSCQVTE